MKRSGGHGEKSNKNAKLERAVYGLKQSGPTWGLCADTLVTEGFEQCKVDDWVVVMTIGVYVDDLMVGGSQEGCESLLLSLKKTFPTNDLRESTWYDGCGIERNAELGTIKLSKKSLR